MASFKKSFHKTMGAEGGASFNPHDPGNVVVKGVVAVPTYKGIAPIYHPNWRGFAIIKTAMADMVKMPQYGTDSYCNWVRYLNSALEKKPQLQQYVEDFYRVNFWNTCRGDEITSQDVADWLFDHNVNGGTFGAKCLQEALAITVDGDVGPKTLAAINAADPAELLREAEDIAAFFRLRRASQNPTQIQFLQSWLTRDGLTDAEILEVRRASRDGRLTGEEVAALMDLIKATA